MVLCGCCFVLDSAKLWKLMYLSVDFHASRYSWCVAKKFPNDSDTLEKCQQRDQFPRAYGQMESKCSENTNRVFLGKINCLGIEHQAHN